MCSCTELTRYLISANNLKQLNTIFNNPTFPKVEPHWRKKIGRGQTSPDLVIGCLDISHARLFHRPQIIIFLIKSRFCSKSFPDIYLQLFSGIFYSYYKNEFIQKYILATNVKNISQELI
ncbi:unnamed protein product [Chrysodeixis includens]|uniref:Uncharacterized protein n=1 Tax=Chrysodeixis includens TaxID=689277 RepID=A0A9N8KZW8_CHRIL|nr:unnamed protein product [Chrysodeixis includens]